MFRPPPAQNAFSLRDIQRPAYSTTATHSLMGDVFFAMSVRTLCSPPSMVFGHKHKRTTVVGVPWFISVKLMRIQKCVVKA